MPARAARGAREPGTVLGMNMSDLHDLPLTDDAILAEGLETLLAPVVRRQLWVLFLDERSVLTGPLMPTDDFPRSPHATFPEAAREGDGRSAAQCIAECFARLVDELDIAQLVLVWERPGSSRIDPQTREWARELHRLFRDLGTRVRAQCLLSDEGLCTVPLDDLL